MPRHLPHPHMKKYNHTCLRCRKRPAYHDERAGIWYSLCLGCLSETALGPFKARLNPIGYDYPSTGSYNHLPDYNIKDFPE